MIYTCICLQCGQRFTTDSYPRRLCSDPCKRDRKRITDAKRKSRLREYQKHWIEQIQTTLNL